MCAVKLTSAGFGAAALPLWAAVVPLATVNICYLIAAGLEHVPTCIPYLSGCTSVSSTGRMAPERMVFLAGMLPSALILACFWRGTAAFLKHSGSRQQRLKLVPLLGVIAALSLSVYAITLGSEDMLQRQLRRAGINGFAVSTFVAQLLFIDLYRPMRIATTEKLWQWLVVLCAALPLLSIASEVAKLIGAGRHGSNNFAAWNAFLVASAWYAVVARIWWHHGFSGDTASTSSGRPASPRE